VAGLFKGVRQVHVKPRFPFSRSRRGAQSERVFFKRVFKVLNHPVEVNLVNRSPPGEVFLKPVPFFLVVPFLKSEGR